MSQFEHAVAESFLAYPITRKEPEERPGPEPHEVPAPEAERRHTTRTRNLPLAPGTGVGSELRRPLGIAIVGGLLFSQMLTLFTTPVVYLYPLRGKRIRKVQPAETPA